MLSFELQKAKFEMRQKLSGMGWSDVRLTHLHKSKVANMSARVISKQNLTVKAKIFTCWDKKYATNLQVISQHLIQHKIKVPAILKVADAFVIADWAEEGRDINQLSEKKIISKIVQYQVKLHTLVIPKKLKKVPAYDHFLLKRFERFSAPFLEAKKRKKILQTMKVSKPDTKTTLTHPDLGLKNLILDSQNDLVLIDNETLSYGTTKEFDILNSAYNIQHIKKFDSEKYLTEYRNRGDVGTLDSHRSYWEALMKIKLAGSIFQYYDYPRGLKYVAELEELLEQL